LFAITPINKGGYKFTATSFAGCATTSAVLTMDSGFIPAPPVVADKKYCLNEPSTALTAVGDSLVWYTVGTGGAGSLTAPTPTTTFIGNTAYWVTRTNALRTCESKRQRLNVIVNPVPGASIKITAKSNLLPGDTTLILAKAETLRSFNRVLWYKNGTYQNTIPDSTKLLRVFYRGVGKYFAEIIDSNLCSSISNEVEIKADIIPGAALYVFPNPVQTSTKVIFTALPNNVTYVKVISEAGLVHMNQKIATTSVGNTAYDLDLSKLPKGVYEIQIITGVGRIIGTRRVIKL
jgi:large repetitive protein